MGLRKQKQIIKRNSPDRKILSCPSMDCPVIDCSSDVVDLGLSNETEDEVIWYGTCRKCRNHFKLIMIKD